MTIQYEYDVDIGKVKIYKTLNTVVVVMGAKSTDMIVGYYLISLRGRVLPKGSLEPAVIPLTVKKDKLIGNPRILEEKVWWYDLNI